MTLYNEVKGDLIQLALKGEFDVVTHGCNCQCVMGAGIAPKMANAFGCNHFRMEGHIYKGDINKLGNIDFQTVMLLKDKSYNVVANPLSPIKSFHFSWKDMPHVKDIVIVNSYTQFNYGKNHVDGIDKPLDYEALRLCLRKINVKFRNKHIGLPKIGCGLAGGSWDEVKKIIKEELQDCQITVVIYDK